MAQILLAMRYHIILHGYNQNIRRDLAVRILPANQGHYHYIVSNFMEFLTRISVQSICGRGFPHQQQCPAMSHSGGSEGHGVLSENNAH